VGGDFFRLLRARSRAVLAGPRRRGRTLWRPPSRRRRDRQGPDPERVGGVSPDFPGGLLAPRKIGDTPRDGLRALRARLE